MFRIHLEFDYVIYYSLMKLQNLPPIPQFKLEKHPSTVNIYNCQRQMFFVINAWSMHGVCCWKDGQHVQFYIMKNLNFHLQVKS